MNVGIVDVGSNNIKLEVFELHDNGSPYLLYSAKFPARLGHEVFLTQKLNPENIASAMEAFQHIAQTLKSFSVKHAVALGTAALREADPEEFLKQVQKNTGIQIEVIPGIEEARIVYQGVLANMNFAGRTYFLNDIGGGSTEISVSDDKNMYFVESLRLGTVRLKEMFEISVEPEAVKMMERYVRKMLNPYLGEIKKYHMDMGLSTGGTASNILEIVRARGAKIEQENGVPILRTADLKELVDAMKKMSPQEIGNMKGLDPSRADIIFPGALLLLSMLEEVAIEKSFVSSHGLRDGAIADFIYRKINRRFFTERQEAYRRHFLEQAAKKYNVDYAHAEQTAEIAGQLFDHLRPLHGFDDNERDILWGATILHDSGRIIDYSGHHKHSQYIIKNINLMGFSEKEIELMSLIARYHRKSMPKSSHPDFSRLKDSHQDKVRKLAAILRIADAFDRSNSKDVRKIESVRIEDDSVTLVVQARSDLSLEMWSLEKKKEMFEKVFHRTLVVEVKH